jgi:uncharacterized protein (TIGR02118 family)
MIAVTVCYKAGRRLDFDYYTGTHVPLLTEKLKPLGLQSAEVRNVLAGGNAGTPPYQLIATLYYRDIEAWERTTGDPRWKAVVDDIANFYPEMPDVLVTEVLK